MKIAVPAQGPKPDSLVDSRFGRAKWFMVYDDEKKSWDVIDNAQNVQSSQGAGIQSAANVVNTGCHILISSHCGPKAFTALTKAGVQVYSAKGGTVDRVVKLFISGALDILDKADVDGHW